MEILRIALTLLVACTKEECGPAMGMPNSTCPDGKTVAAPACLRDEAGKCSYVVVECPP